MGLSLFLTPSPPLSISAPIDLPLLPLIYITFNSQLMPLIFFHHFDELFNLMNAHLERHNILLRKWTLRVTAYDSVHVRTLTLFFEAVCVFSVIGMCNFVFRNLDSFYYSKFQNDLKFHIEDFLKFRKTNRSRNKIENNFVCICNITKTKNMMGL